MYSRMTAVKREPDMASFGARGGGCPEQATIHLSHKCTLSLSQSEGEAEVPGEEPQRGNSQKNPPQGFKLGGSLLTTAPLCHQKHKLTLKQNCEFIMEQIVLLEDSLL